MRARVQVPESHAVHALRGQRARLGHLSVLRVGPSTVQVVRMQLGGCEPWSMSVETLLIKVGKRATGPAWLGE